MIKENCFANKNGKCIALKETKCDGCSFFKTTEQYNTERKKSMDRLIEMNYDLEQYSDVLRRIDYENETNFFRN